MQKRNDARIIGLGLVVVVALLCLTFDYLGVTNALLLGWLAFLQRVVPGIHVRIDGLLIFVVGFVIAVVCTHIMAVWLSREVSHRLDVVRTWRLRTSVSLVALLLMMFVIGIAVSGVVHQTGWLLSSPASLAVSEVQTAKDAQLSRYDPHEAEIGQSWITQVLYYLSAVPPTVDSSEPWNGPKNAAGFRAIIPDAICPSQGYPIRSPDGFGLSHVTANDELFRETKPRRIDRFDQTSETIMLGEVNAGLVPWGSQENVRPTELGINQNWNQGKPERVGYGSFHQRGANFTMLDGSVRFLSHSTDQKVLRDMGRLKTVNSQDGFGAKHD